MNFRRQAVQYWSEWDIDFFFAFVEIAVNVNTGELLRQQNNKKKFSADGWIFASKG